MYIEEELLIDHDFSEYVQKQFANLPDQNTTLSGEALSEMLHQWASKFVSSKPDPIKVLLANQDLVNSSKWPDPIGWSGFNLSS